MFTVCWCCLSLFLSAFFCLSLSQLKESVMCPVRPCRKLTVRLIDVTRALVSPTWNLCLFPLSVPFSISAHCCHHLSVPTRKTKQNIFFRLSFKPTADVILYVPSSWFWKRIDCIVHVMFVGLFTAQREPYLVSSLYVCGWNEFDLRCVRSARCCMRERIFFIFDFQPSEAICMENLPNVSWSKWILI